jgi:hypothetical protein
VRSTTSSRRSGKTRGRAPIADGLEPRTLLAAGGGTLLLIERGAWPLTNEWFVLVSGLAACPFNRLSGRTRFVAAFLIWLAGQIARRVSL